MTLSWDTILTTFRQNQASALRSMDRQRQHVRKQHAEGRKHPGAHWNTLSGLAFRGMQFLIASGPDLARRELEPCAFVAQPAVPDFVDAFADDQPIPHYLLEIASGVCVMQCLGIDVGPDPLPQLKPLLVGVDTRRSDEYVHPHWNRALIALVLDDRITWGPIAGFMPRDAVPFRPGATFAFNMQGLLAHLAGGMLHGAGLADVEPAWRDFVRCYPALTSAKLADEDTLLWVARLVFHHIGGQPLGEVAARIYEAVCAAEEHEG
jgi:hypothetical protein